MELKHRINLSNGLIIELCHSITNDYKYVNIWYRNDLISQMPFTDFKELVKNVQNNIDTFEIICEKFKQVLK